MKALLVAHHANPELTSEPLIGWRWVKALRSRCDVTLVTHVRNRGAIERAGIAPARVLYVDTERVARFVKRVNDRLFPNAGSVNRLLLETVAQVAFDREATRIARRLVDAGEIDVIHRVSPISPRYASRLGRLGVPFVLGPVNGGLAAPAGFGGVAKQEGHGLLRLRGLARVLDPLARTMRSADALLVANETTRNVLPKGLRAKAEVLCENAVEAEMFPAVERGDEPGLRALFLGRLLPYKGVQFILRAMSALPRGLVRLDVVGDGAMRGELVALRNELGLADVVTFHGNVPQERVPEYLTRADALVLPSVRESGGAVVLEGMAAGLPVVVADHGGPAETVVDGTGFRIDCPDEKTLVAGLVQALADLARRPEKRRAMGLRGRAHVLEHGTWDARAERALEVYRNVIDRRTERSEAGALNPEPQGA